MSCKQFIQGYVEMAKVYYKVVNKKLESVVASKWRGWKIGIDWSDFVVKYKIGEWVSPKIDKTDLMVFKKLNQAVNFSIAYEDSIIYKCNIRNPKKIGIFIENLLAIPELVKKFVQFKNKKVKYTNQIQTRFIPKGTVFCSAVKLIERIP